jgi:hypothetical protein
LAIIGFSAVAVVPLTLAFPDPTPLQKEVIDVFSKTFSAGVAGAQVRMAARCKRSARRSFRRDNPPIRWSWGRRFREGFVVEDYAMIFRIQNKLAPHSSDLVDPAASIPSR